MLCLEFDKFNFQEELPCRGDSMAVSQIVFYELDKLTINIYEKLFKMFKHTPFNLFHTSL